MGLEPLIPPLLGPGNPAPCEIFNTAGGAPLPIVCDHAPPAARLAACFDPCHGAIAARLPVPLMAALRTQNPGLVVDDNEPYSAMAPAGYTMRRHAETAGLPHALVELRRDLVATESGAARWAEILAAAPDAVPL